MTRMTIGEDQVVTALHSVPADPLKAVFTTEAWERWRTVRDPSEALRFRMDVLGACGPEPLDLKAAMTVRHLRAVKAAWSTYLEASFVCGMFEGERGADVLARLTGINDEDFRSAMAECLVCWFLAGRLRLPVVGQARGRGGKNLDMKLLLSDGDVGVEVKAPFRERPQPPPGEHSTAWFGDDTDKISQCLKAANKQFSDESANILVIVPELRTSICGRRRELINAAYGGSVIKLDWDEEAGNLKNQRLEFVPNGAFLNTRRPGGKPLKLDGLPACRRISVILCIEEKICERYPFPLDVALAASKTEEDRADLYRLIETRRTLWASRANTMWMEHDALVLHNPYAYYQVSEDLWQGLPQLVPRGEKMVWTDGFSEPV